MSGRKQLHLRAAFEQAFHADSDREKSITKALGVVIEKDMRLYRSWRIPHLSMTKVLELSYIMPKVAVCLSKENPFVLKLFVII